MILYAHINGVDPFLVYSDKLLLGIGLFCFLLLFCFPAIFSYLLCSIYCSSLTNLLVSCIVTICAITKFSFVTWPLLTILLEYLTVLLENLDLFNFSGRAQQTFERAQPGLPLQLSTPLL